MDQRVIRGKTRVWKHGKGRRTLLFIDEHPAAEALYQHLINAEGWPYRTERVYYQTRDRALCALLFMIGTRISETLRLETTQFIRAENLLLVKRIQLSKRPEGKKAFRPEAYLTLTGKRRDFTLLIVDYLNHLAKHRPEQRRLFPFGNARAYQIVSTMLGIPPHWLRAYCENFLFDEWQRDAVAVSDYMRVDLATLLFYLRGRFKKYTPV